MRLLIALRHGWFQSTRPRGRTRQVPNIQRLRISRFNPRVLAGGRDESCAYVARYIMFQSTRPRGRTRQRSSCVFANCDVSIHASSREDATSMKHPASIVGWVSIHASSREDATSPLAFFNTLSMFQSTRPRGRTRPAGHTTVATPLSFNPRVLAGGRDSVSVLRCSVFQVSIHASSREDATVILILY